jgi:hypothetical protein
MHRFGVMRSVCRRWRELLSDAWKKIEYMIVTFDHQERNAKLLLSQDELLLALPRATEQLREQGLTGRSANERPIASLSGG